MSQDAQALISMFGSQTVIPVIRLEHVENAVPLARALAAGGLRAVEITLRTEAALEAVMRIAEDVPEAIVGAGTVLDAHQFELAIKAGARFIVSPGMTQELLDAARDAAAPLLPGAITPSEIMAAREEGYSLLKFFPAEQAGGADFLRALASPLPAIRFCPTGGITAANAGRYLTLPNVLCVGGSWVAPQALIAAGDWKGITRLAREASTLPRH
jgi:2-dehydro-3-deoxyphosphogluconate aldolase/(4S)-4-hydroxy-2-oxoglutarate aldolase